ncbi:MAG: molybdate ABC transporter substrate-binding protein [Candidatus Sericytochromatia bacterium]|nr:molybdate ABC transporter substrate-binding protein [Candidatus Sericytochromatia bacterium]
MIKPINNIISDFEKENNIKVIVSYGSSATLAKQIDQEMKADIFISASSEWIDYLDKKAKIKNESKKDFLGNSLVLIANKNNNIETSNILNFKNIIGDCISISDPDYVPLGKYTKQALQNINQWNEVLSKSVRGNDAVSTLYVVERGECSTGIVYKTDAINSKNVNIIYEITLPKGKNIFYTIALTKNKNINADKLYKNIFSKKSNKIFSDFGFKILG